MYLFRAVVYQVADCLGKLCPSYDRVVYQHEFLVSYDLENRHELHFRYAVSRLLVLRHKASRPCRRVFDERSSIRHSRFVGISQRVSHSAVRHACNIVHVQVPVLFRQESAVAVSHKLDVAPFVYRSRISEIRPQECADLHLVLRIGNCLFTVRRDECDLCRSQLALVSVPYVYECE